MEPGQGYFSFLINMQMNPIISAKELKSSIDNGSQVIVLDARTGQNAHANYLQEHLKGAVLIDLDRDLAEIGEDASQGGRHPLPNLGQFVQKLTAAGITTSSHVIVYDTANGANAAARCWWMLKSAGVENVQVLSGGLAAAKL